MLIDKVNIPKDLKEFSDSQLVEVADELRQKVISSVSKTGGHLGAGLGVVELTVAIHSVFNTPEDRLIWDVGHQAYPHKILTGRKDRMHTLRKGGGLSGFTKRDESEYDPFGAGHSSTSISAGLGMSIARDKLGKNNEVIAVIGDGSMSAGMAYEALNNAGAEDSKLIVILNDNDMSIAPPTGAMSAYLSKLISGKTYNNFRNFAIKAVKHLPEYFERAAKKTEQMAKDIAVGGNFFEELGFNYVGPLDGHNLEHLLPVLRNIRDNERQGPFLVHVVTEKGHGFDSPEASKEKYHAVKTFDEKTKVQTKSTAGAKTYTQVYAESLISEAKEEEKIIAVTAAMPSGTGIDKFGEEFPDRTYDVGIAEQHAVTFSAGLASEGLKPFCTLYSTFLQRGYDQVVHDVAIQNLPVRFAIDRAGLVGADGPTHAGSFDVSYMGCLPNMVVMAASDENELRRMVKTAVEHDSSPIAFRFPRGESLGLEELSHSDVKPLSIGKGKIVKDVSSDEDVDVAILSFGTRLQEALKAEEELSKDGLNIIVADARFAKPIDEDLVKDLASRAKVLITIEEGSIGGFGSFVQQFLTDNDLLNGSLKMRSMVIPDEYINHDAPYEMYNKAKLNAPHIIEVAKACLNK